MKQFVLNLTQVLLFLMVTSCAQYFPLSPSDSPRDIQNSGFIIGSIEELSTGGFPDNVVFYYRRFDAEGQGGIGTGFIYTDQENVFTELGGKKRGGVFLVELPPGQYGINNYNIFNFGTAYVPISPILANFMVHKNRVTYIGSINIKMYPEQMYPEPDSVRINKFELVEINIIDKYDRDLPLLLKNYRFLSGMNVDKNIIKLKADRGGHRQF